MKELTRKMVDAVGDAFNANDIDEVMQYFAPNAIFDHAVGTEEHGVSFPRCRCDPRSFFRSF